jgi:hypothetical protein
MHTTDASQTTPPPSPNAAPYPPDPTLVLPSSIYYQVVHTLGGLLPAPVSDTPEALAHRDNDAIAHVASLLPGNADEAHLAARVAAADADAYAMDCLRLAHDCRVAPMLFLKCTAQATSMMREARGARTQLMRIQAERRKRESDNATRDQAAWIEHCAIGLMMQAQPGAAPVAMPDPPPPAAGPVPAGEPRTEPGCRGRPVCDYISTACRADPQPRRRAGQRFVRCAPRRTGAHPGHRPHPGPAGA